MSHAVMDEFIDDSKPHLLLDHDMKAKATPGIKHSLLSSMNPIGETHHSR